MKGLSRKILIAILAVSAMTVSSVSVSAMDIPIGNIGSTDISDTQEPKETLYTAIHNNVQVNMTENPVTMFKDIKGNEWFIGNLTAPIHFGVLSGYEDGTLRPDNSITSPEIAKIIATTFEGEDGKEVKQGTPWYGKYYKQCQKAFTYDNLYFRHAYFLREMTRAEIAYIISNYVSGNVGGVDADLSVLAKFQDCGLIANDDDGTYEKDKQLIESGYIPSRYAKSLAYLVDKGVFQGREDGGSWYLDPVKPVRRSEVFTLLMNMCRATPSYQQGQFTGDIKVEYKEEFVYDPTFDGDKGLLDAKVEPFEEWQSRGPITARYDDVSRPRLKVGDTFIAPDGKSYYLDHTGVYVGDVEIAGVGLPIACDLGRQTTIKGTTSTVENGFRPSNASFGWLYSSVSTNSDTYIVFEQTGEGHWETEWEVILRQAKPSETGSDGQTTADGLFTYRADLNRWVNNVLN